MSGTTTATAAGAHAVSRVAVVTGSRADFGLLRPVLHAIDAHEGLHLIVYVTGTHLLGPDLTRRDVEAAFPGARAIEMQRDGAASRARDAVALGRGVTAFARALADDLPDAVVVLGDRIEALAAAAAASIGGVRVAHLHGGDRAEGIADEAIRHAITKLAHLHFPATAQSAERIIAMGEPPARTHLVGSPALDGLEAIGPIDDDAYEAHGRPELVVLLHPTGADDDVEAARARTLLLACRARGRVLALEPNHDPGRDGISSAIEATAGISRAGHLPRPAFVGLLRRARALVGNSSAGLIECAALPVPSVDVGDRQAGRERPETVVPCASWSEADIVRALDAALAVAPAGVGSAPPRHPYGDGRAGRRVADTLAAVLGPGVEVRCPLRKRNTY